MAIQHPSRQPNPYERSRNASAYIMPGLFFDLDLRSGAHAASALPATETEALAFLDALPAKPSSSCARVAEPMATGSLSLRSGYELQLIALP